MQKQKLISISLVVVLIAVGALFAFWPKTPTKLVDDQVKLFSFGEQDRLEAYHRKLLEEYDIDYRVAAVATTDEIARQANEMFRELSVGAASSSGRGILLMIDIGGDRVRLEVSDALEPIYTDAFTAYIQTQQMVPFLLRVVLPMAFSLRRNSFSRVLGKHGTGMNSCRQWTAMPLAAVRSAPHLLAAASRHCRHTKA